VAPASVLYFLNILIFLKAYAAGVLPARTQHIEMPIRVNTLLTTRQGGVKFPLETVMSDEKDYQQQIEAGKTFVRETFAQLATDLKQADINLSVSRSPAMILITRKCPYSTRRP